MLTAPSSVRANVAFSVTVTALDRFNNTATGFRDTVHFSSSQRKTKLPADYTFTASDNGVHTFTNGVTFTRTGPATLTVSDRSNSGVASAQANFTVTTIPLAGPGSPIETDDLGDLLGGVLGDDNTLDPNVVLIVLDQLKDEGVLKAFFAQPGDRKKLVAQLTAEIDAYLAGDVSLGDFHWL
jgi:hypothetical protein